jgi:predicted nuclease with RNAse H fold
MRDAERTLRKRRIGVYPPLIPHMQGLTARGMRLAVELRARGHAVIECFPGVAQDALGLPRKQADLEGLQRGLARLGFRVGGKRSHDELDAVTAALVGFYYLVGDYEAVGDPEEGQIVVPTPDNAPETTAEE